MTVPYPRGGSRRLKRPANPQRTPWWQTVLGLLLLAAAAYSAGTTYATGQESQERAECQARVNQQVVRALQVRDDANRTITEAQRAVVRARLQNVAPGITPRQADRQYLVALDDLSRVRAANPIEGAQTC